MPELLPLGDVLDDVAGQIELSIIGQTMCQIRILTEAKLTEAQRDRLRRFARVNGTGPVRDVWLFVPGFEAEHLRFSDGVEL